MHFLSTALALALVPTLAAQGPLPLPDLDAATRIWCVADGKEKAWPELLDELAAFDVVFLGETHVDDTTHRVEQHVLEGLLERRKGKVVLSMEMFESDSQPVLDAYLRGEIEEDEFVRRAGAWPNYRTGYRALIETAKAAGIPVVAANFPRSLRRALAGGGKQAIERLTPEQRALMPEEIHPASAAYWKRVDNAIRGHMGMGGARRTPEQRRYETQNLWDNSMGDHVAKAHQAHPDAVVLHVAGGFHVAYKDGTVAQFARRSPESRFGVVECVPVESPEFGRPDRDGEQGDYLIYCRPVARGLHDGDYAVSVAAELRFRLEVPSGGEPRPLLVWLPGASSRSIDALAFWKRVLGDRAAIAVVEPPFPERQDDLAMGGRYAFSDGYRSDYGRVQSGLVRLVEYVSRFWPIDEERVVVAGEGAGGTAVLWSAIYGQWLPGDHLAVDPASLGRLAHEALPDQRPPVGKVQLVGVHGDLMALAKLAGDLGELGVETSMAQIDEGIEPLVAVVGERLGLSVDPGARSTDGEMVLWLAEDTPRAREWAELFGAGLWRAGYRVRIGSGDRPSDASHLVRLEVGGSGRFGLKRFADGTGLPLAGGDFGGTTVVVLPEGVPDAEREIWLDYERRKVIKQRSMFANLAIAEWDGERALPKVLSDLRRKGRTRVLVVPAVFCTGAETMRRLRGLVGEAARGLDLHWLPGLGGELCR